MKHVVKIDNKHVTAGALVEVLRDTVQTLENHETELFAIAKTMDLTVNEITEVLNFIQGIVNSPNLFDETGQVIAAIATSSLNYHQKPLAAWHYARMQEKLRMEGGEETFLQRLDRVSKRRTALELYGFTSLEEMEIAIAEGETILGESELDVRLAMVKCVLETRTYSDAVNEYFTTLLVRGLDESSKQLFELLKASYEHTKAQLG